jgi:pyruvate formate lyase activating enzyme
VGLITDIQRFSVDDGPGIRTTVFFKGCNLSCVWCHNPETKKTNPQVRTVAGRSIVCGREISPEEVVSIILRDAAYYRHFGGGVTFSGGEPLLQHEFLAECLKLCRENGINTAVDTAGCVTFDKFEPLLSFADLFLYDVKLTDESEHIKYTGVSNILILENLRRLIESGANVTVRTLLLPGVNDNVAYFKDFALFIAKFNVKKVDVLPYHSMGENKYAQIGEEYRFLGKTAPDEKMTEQFREIIRQTIK